MDLSAEEEQFVSLGMVPAVGWRSHYLLLDMIDTSLALNL